MSMYVLPLVLLGNMNNWEGGLLGKIENSLFLFCSYFLQLCIDEIAK